MPIADLRNVYTKANLRAPPHRGNMGLSERIRFFVIREPVRQLELLDDEPKLPFPSWQEVTQQGRRVVWKLRAVVTNRCSTSAPDIIQWYRDRCGKSEEKPMR